MQKKSFPTGIVTEKFLQSLSASNDGQRITDRDSMYGIVRTRQNGISVLFRWRFRFEGGHLDYNCGTWPGEKLSAIRQNRRDAEAVLRSGKNPNDEKRAERLRKTVEQKSELTQLAAALVKGRTVQESMDDWFTSKVIEERKDRGAYVKRAFAKDVNPSLGSLALIELRRGDVMDVLHSIASRAPVMANRIHAQLNQFFEYCVSREWIERNPLHGTKRDAIGGSEPPRQRILCHESDPSKHEFKELLAGIAAASLPTDV